MIEMGVNINNKVFEFVIKIISRFIDNKKLENVSCLILMQFIFLFLIFF